MHLTFATYHEAYTAKVTWKLPANVRPVFVQDLGRWALLVNSSRQALPTLKD